jgi:hypothetical protein
VNHLIGVIHIDNALHDQSGYPIRVDAPRQVVSRGN